MPGDGIGLSLDNPTDQEFIFTVDDVEFKIGPFTHISGLPVNPDEHKFVLKDANGKVLWDTTCALPEDGDAQDDWMVNVGGQEYVVWTMWYTTGADPNEDPVTITLDGREYEGWLRVIPKTKRFHDLDDFHVQIDEPFPQEATAPTGLSTMDKLYRKEDFKFEAAFELGEIPEAKNLDMLHLDYFKSGKVHQVIQYTGYYDRNVLFKFDDSTATIPQGIVDRYPTKPEDFKGINGEEE